MINIIMTDKEKAFNIVGGLIKNELTTLPLTRAIIDHTFSLVGNVGS